VRDGYVFAGWNATTNTNSKLQVTPTDTIFDLALDGSVSDITLQAQWTPRYTVSYNTNGGAPVSILPRQNVYWETSGLLPALAPLRDGYELLGWEVILQGNATGMVVTLDDLKTATYGSLVTAQSGTVSTPSLTLVAQWAPKAGYSVKFNLNGGTSAAIGDLTGLNWTDPVVLPASPTRPNFVFAGWNVVVNGQGTDVVASTPYSDLATDGSYSYIILQAQWTAEDTYTVKYDLNGANSRSVANKVEVYWDDADLIPATVPVRFGYDFAGWDVTVNGSGTDVLPTATYGSLAASTTDTFITLQAQWTEKVSFTVNYDLNAGTGTTSPSAILPLTGVRWTQTGLVPSVPTPTLIDDIGDVYVFTGWNVSAGGTGVNVKPSDSYSNLAFDDSVTALTLQAQWTLEGTYAVKYDINQGTVTVSGTVVSGIPDKTLKEWLDDNLLPELSENTSIHRLGYHVQPGAEWVVVENGSGIVEDTTDLLADHGEDPGVPFITLQIQWEPNPYKIYYDTNGGTLAGDDVFENGTLYEKDGVVYWWSEDLVADNDPVLRGYIFAGWALVETGGGGLGGFASLSITEQTLQTLASSGVSSQDAYGVLAEGDDSVESIILVAQWLPKSHYNVHYDLDNGDVLDSLLSVSWEDTDLLPSTNPSKMGHAFTGWNVTENGSVQSVTSLHALSELIDDEDIDYIILQAQYSPNQYTVKFIDWDGTLISSQQITNNKAATAPTNPTRAGYTFIGWDKSFAVVEGDLIVTALYKALSGGQTPQQPTGGTPSTLPYTGDNAGYLIVLAAVLVLGGTGILAVVSSRRKRSGK
jgi:uncharacterized repeat protein (TIGR02543 family)/LPXTG-motif cell wall-anchored protein